MSQFGFEQGQFICSWLIIITLSSYLCLYKSRFFIYIIIKNVPIRYSKELWFVLLSLLLFLSKNPSKTWGPKKSWLLYFPYLYTNRKIKSEWHFFTVYNKRLHYYHAIIFISDVSKNYTTFPTSISTAVITT